MVTIVDFKARVNESGEVFNVLILQGSPEFVKSIKTNKMYMTARRASVFCTFDDSTCQALIGTQYPGTIKKVPCEEYDYTIPESGEVIKLNFSYQYSDEAETTEEAVFERA